jgi:hypothetical protein
MEDWSKMMKVHLSFYVISYVTGFTFLIIFMRLSLVENASVEVTSYNLMKCYGRSEREKDAQLELGESEDE